MVNRLRGAWTGWAVRLDDPTRGSVPGFETVPWLGWPVHVSHVRPLANERPCSSGQPHQLCYLHGRLSLKEASVVFVIEPKSQ